MAFLKNLYFVVLPVITAYTTHYVSANLYTRICASDGIIGFLTSLMTTGSPVCNSLLTIINSTHNSYALILTNMVSILAGAALFRGHNAANTDTS